MRVFHCPEEKKLIIVIGLGLIGSEIAYLISKSNKYQAVDSAIGWDDPLFFRNQFLHLVKEFLKYSLVKVDLIWAAGKSGFGSSQEQCEAETAHFFHWVDCLRGLEVVLPQQLTIHLISSAGGLFEGQLKVDQDSKPSPKRPYGIYKLKQEEYLKSHFPNAYRIYRPSSVFGKILDGKRVGLISILIENGIKNKETVIFGSLDTLRNFVFVEDVAYSVFKVLNEPQHFSDKVFFLISDRSASIFEVIHLIRRLTGKKVVTRFVQVQDPLSICFSPKLNLFKCSDYNFGIIKLIHGSL
jgi:nucleoside-diphosphate-sugar epimerase